MSKITELLFGHKHKLTAIVAPTRQGWGYPSGEWQVKYRCECGYKEVVELMWNHTGSIESERWAGAVSNVREQVRFNVPKFVKTYNEIAEGLKPEKSIVVKLKTRSNAKELRRVRDDKLQSTILWGVMPSNYYIPKGAYK